MKNSERAFKKVNNIFSSYCGEVPEADEKFNNANRSVIKSLAKEHNGNVVLFKFWPSMNTSEKGSITKYDPSMKLYNFCADFVVPSDSDNYQQFVDAVNEFRKNGMSGSILNKIANTATACGGYPLSFV